MVNRYRCTSTAQMLKGGAGRSLPPLPIIDRASICPCPVGKADPASAHVPLVNKALRYLAYPCCLRSRLRMEVFGLSPTFHVSVPLLVSSSEWPAGSLGPPSRKPPPSRSRATQHLCEMTLFVPFARAGDIGVDPGGPAAQASPPSALASRPFPCESGAQGGDEGVTSAGPSRRMWLRRLCACCAGE